jgi:hypothetical protein
MEGPVELGIGQGIFGREDGEVAMHFHGLIMDKNGNIPQAIWFPFRRPRHSGFDDPGV